MTLWIRKSVRAWLSGFFCFRYYWERLFSDISWWMHLVEGPRRLRLHVWYFGGDSCKDGHSWDHSLEHLHIISLPRQSQNSQTSYMVVQGSKNTCSSKKSGNCTAFYNSTLEVIEDQFYHALFGWSSHKPIHIQGKGREIPSFNKRSVEEFAAIFQIATTPYLTVQSFGPTRYSGNFGWLKMELQNGIFN